MREVINHYRVDSREVADRPLEMKHKQEGVPGKWNCKQVWALKT